MSNDPAARLYGPTLRPGRGGTLAFRLDRPAAGAADPDGSAPDPSGKSPAETPGLLALIVKALRSEPRERRGGPRHGAAGREVWLGWWSGDDFHSVSGRARDISRGGANVLLAVRPPRRRPVWLYKEVDDTAAFARAEVVGVTPAPGGWFAARLRFAVPCPTLLLQAVACDPPPGRRPRASRFVPPER